MTNTLARRTQATPRNLLARILDEPGLVRAVQALPPTALLRIIDRVGLEDAGELVALATVDQLRRVFDEDVWRSGRPGEDERFDPARFTLWLEVMLEAGEPFTADTLAEMSEDLVVLALHHHVLAISLEELALLISEGEGQVPLEKVIEDSDYVELGDYCVIARRREDWDTIAAVLLALDERHATPLQRILERLWRVTSDYVYGQGGLYEVLTSEEMLESDAAAEREDRRARSGFVAASSAGSFLSLARGTDVASLLARPSRDPITRAFFRGYETAASKVDAAGSDESSREAEPALLRELLDEAADAAPAPRLLESGRAAQPPAQTLLARALVELAARDSERHEERMRELGYLANMLVAGVGVQGARLRPLDAAEAALAACNLGLERALVDSPAGAAERLERLSCDVLFRVGWRLLHDAAARPAATAIERVATRLARADESPREQAALERLAAAARKALQENRPAAPGARLDLLAGALDDTQRARLAALSDSLPALLAADGAARTWIASAAQLGDARAFLEAL
jgi:hypothetical protein